MNIIGFFVPKVIMLLVIWIPNYECNTKMALTVIYVCKIIFDYDIARPGHCGRIYKLTKQMDFENGAVFISVLSLVLTLVLEIVAVASKAWLPSILGGISIVFLTIDLISNIKDSIRAKSGGNYADNNH